MSFKINTINDAKLDEYTLKREDLFKQTSRSYTNEEMATVFQLYNSYNPNAKKSDTGCGSCRRQVLNFMTAKWHQLKKESEPNV
jgi:hypothetical protein